MAKDSEAALSLGGMGILTDINGHRGGMWWEVPPGLPCFLQSTGS